MSDYKTPGVYVEEISSLPPSVSQVATAIPAFIGYTEKGTKNTPTRISNMLDYQNIFGGPKKTTYTATLDEDGNNTLASLDQSADDNSSNYLLYYNMQLFFANGGGSCYIVSVGDYTETKDKDNYTTGLAAIANVDEPTLLVLTDALGLTTEAEYYTLCEEALSQCGTLKDRFTIIDLVYDDDDGSKLREGIASDYLDYGAAYTPHLNTTISYQYDETGVSVVDPNVTLDPGDESPTLDSIKTTQTALYNQIKSQLNQQYITLPPGAAIAGVYARVDANRGVWKAPANVAVSGVTGPYQKISNEEQGSLNIDVTSGKSINAIRNFTGQGTLVWGARTLMGNDNNWRYINVRRLFITIEESVQKSTAFAVFEPNDATTWLKVKAMVDNYLYGLWQQGALAGSTPESSYYVNIGLGKTMTSQDVLEGRMIVQIGVAPVRPAEFIVLQFSQILQEA